VERKYHKKRDELEENVEFLEGDVSVSSRLADNFTFQVRNSQVLLSHSMHNEWVVDFGCTHHMANDASLFTSLNELWREIYIFLMTLLLTLLVVVMFPINMGIFFMSIMF
jgi:hypothetical protein